MIGDDDREPILSLSSHQNLEGVSQAAFFKALELLPEDRGRAFSSPYLYMLSSTVVQATGSTLRSTYPLERAEQCSQSERWCQISRLTSTNDLHYTGDSHCGVEAMREVSADINQAIKTRD